MAYALCLLKTWVVNGRYQRPHNSWCWRSGWNQISQVSLGTLYILICVSGRLRLTSTAGREWYHSLGLAVIALIQLILSGDLESARS